MFSKRSLGGIWKPKNPHSLEYLKYLHGVLNKNAVVTETNRSLLVEALRAIAEILIWGDQNDPSVFDFFLEKNMLGFFLRIMKQKCGRYVCTQLLQTLNILFENISNETSLYYLLSNNHVNSIITHRFDFSDEEILAYYISFLKTLSLKLNGNTIHFFFNEHTNDFPLYTEAIKFFNHSESMVRIAVRTLTLNVYRVFSVPVNDPAMLIFIRDNAAAPYFSNFVFFIANHIVDIDSCLASSESSSHQARDKLADLMAEHLDHIHYMNDVMCLNIDSLNAVLTDQLLKKLFIPIYLGCLSSDYRFDGAARVSPIMALFLLSQIFLVVTHTPLVERLASILMLGDESALCDEGAMLCVSADQTDSNKTDEEKLRKQDSQDGDDPLTAPDTLSKRPLLAAVLNTLDCKQSDHQAFFSLCLIYSIYQNSGISPALLQCAQLSTECPENGIFCLEIIRCLLRIISQSVEQDGRVRVVTLETCCATLKQITCNSDGQCSSIMDQFLADLVSARETIIAQLRQHVERDDIFLDLFEDEYRQMRMRNFSISILSTDASMLLPPAETPLSGVDFVKRLPCGPQERTRRAIRIFLLIRDLLQDIGGEEDDFHRTFNGSPIVKVDDCLNLSNSDLLACTVVAKDGSKCQRFLVTGGLQLMLVEPDSKKLGWGVVRFAGFLQDCEVAGDKEESRALNVTVLAPAAKARPNSQQLLSARMIFDDHIRCMAAKQRLTKGRQKARQYKMDVISHLLELRGSSENVKDIIPPPPLLANVVGRQMPVTPGYVAVDHSRRRNDGENNSDQCNSHQKATRLPQSSSGRRRVRVLSAESVANDQQQKDNLQLVAAGGEQEIPMKEFTPNNNMDGDSLVEEEKLESNNDLKESFSFSSLSKRSSSLSPRVVPRFGISAIDDEEETSSSSSNLEKKHANTSFVGRGRSANTKMKEGVVEIREEIGETTTPSLQCFVGKKKISSQVLDI